MNRIDNVYAGGSSFTNDITLSEVINYGIQFDRADILLNSFDINEEWDDDKQDYEAMKLLPEKYKINSQWKLFF
ncbi:hypothetical protein RhiirA5_405824 [Rhizophagus irregularis]|uniref:Uncharacterized protein n=2 Tax=Rhizophagus irregularis TaxID=588596 RepID=U9UG66_RHIID|nr:hypothetical protein GLOIN_2v1872638 [Rhizophagus irregularis DAOM 181602=DAOM 197198]PKC17437.1 hypothetical protein RhiirA5_405824 [Rhizophagus irregularis]PKY28433.1 hypothetical protein RhiirB3_444606 [Rhizophagus irregularis]POG75816.1 hypothetical protein GLOIN_2v1872638 [Rhizophagus irregularis DAOM 181602=DAOM 197198]|eukprot:XP_025182682.1 hypothetical protein GLOIN_2v1872638 [Rhizophagus irregularis DAOM 181602=DAOM 197198]